MGPLLCVCVCNELLGKKKKKKRKADVEIIVMKLQGLDIAFIHLAFQSTWYGHQEEGC